VAAAHYCGKCAPVKCRAKSSCGAPKPTRCSLRAACSNPCAAPRCSKKSIWQSASYWPLPSDRDAVRTRAWPTRGSKIAFSTCHTRPKITPRRPKSWTICSRRCPTFGPCAYCVGYHVDKAEVRTFVLDRMRDTECATTERFDLPPDFQIDQYFQGEFGIWKDPKPHRVVIDFDARAAEYVRMRKVHASQKLAAIGGGGVRLTMTVGNLNQVVSWVLEWGARAKVVEPEDLADRVREELEGALALYAGPKRTRKPTKK
jgi:hypothetical protein